MSKLETQLADVGQHHFQAAALLLRLVVVAGFFVMGYGAYRVNGGIIFGGLALVVTYLALSRIMLFRRGGFKDYSV